MIKRLITILLAALICILLVACGEGTGDSAKPEQYIFAPKENVVYDRQYYTGIPEIIFPDKLWSVPDYECAPEYDRNDQGVKAYFIESVDYNGAPTYVFAYVGLPDCATKDNPSPGIVLVHGGGGTAFADWVKMWNDRGYAAIAIDTEGKIPNANASLSSIDGVSYESIKHHGPENTGYGDCEKNVNQQYLYHAISATIAANSFLASFEQVDGSKIGLTGISWGGVIATNTAAYDDRFAFVAPVYGAVGMTGTSGKFGTLYQTYPRSSYLWDDPQMLKNCRTPILFVNSDSDPFFAVEGTEKCADTAINGKIKIISDLNHSHMAGATIGEILNFANGVLQRK